jgi:predicted AlkP superfamily phosphohydrolase/phosphomutase
MMRARRYLPLAVALFVCLFVVEPPPVHAYIGPGAGFAFVSSFFAVLAALGLAFLKLITFPFRWLIRSVRWRKALRRSRVRQVVVVGLDGQDPELTDRFLAEGILPNFARLRDQGSYVRLESSYPSESPVAWSCFQTGCNPGRHRVFDFLVPSRKSYLPELCSAKVTAPARTLKLGKYRFPLGQPTVDLGRKSKSFWKILGDNGIFSTIIRVPITFPPEKFHGALLSAMCVPDLKGSQGTFSYYSSDPAEQAAFTGGIQIPVEPRDGVVRSYVSGPDNTMVEGGTEMRVPFEVRLGRNGADASLLIGGKRHPLKLRQFTPWIEVKFRPALRFGVRGICRFYLKEVAPHFKLYMTPVNIDPDKPALPISHPFTYAVYLSKTQGRYSTLGLAEDTWGLNERVLDEDAFLDLAWLIHEERERMFFDALEKTKRGTVVCVFDITDRLQHMFFRYLEPDHPANRGKDVERHRDAIRDLYKKMDDLVGRVMDRVPKDAVLMVMSDHGFKPFRRGVNLNTWLWRNGYLVLKDKPTGDQWYQDVDWSKTRAYAVGLGGIYLNLRGRRAQGIVEPGDEEARLRKELQEKLRGLRDEEKGASAVAEVYDLKEMYRGPYVGDAPDLLVGFRVGWRVSWNCATGTIDEEIFEDNVKSWSGDHCMNPPDVPGIFLCNRKLPVDRISIMDIGPTVLDLFGVPVPPYCDGKPHLTADDVGTTT